MADHYEPAEDSLMLLRHVKDHAHGLVLDMGAGSGILAVEAAKHARLVIAADITLAAVRAAAKASRKEGLNNLLAVHSDLFSFIRKRGIKEKALILGADLAEGFDLIIFNPPYLPNDKRAADIAIDGGPHGHELIRGFLLEASDHLKEEGRILLLFSSLTGKSRVDQAAYDAMLEFELLEEKRIFFESLYVYLIRKSQLLAELHKRGIRGVRLLARGRHGTVFSGLMGRKTVAIKVDGAVSCAQREAYWLGIMNRHGLAPRLITSSQDCPVSFLVMELIQGKPILEFLANSDKGTCCKIILRILRALALMDRLGINKEELHRPVKHIIIRGQGARARPVLIDFERCSRSSKPKNLRQFIQFLCSARLRHVLNGKGITVSAGDVRTLRSLCMSYKYCDCDKACSEALQDIMSGIRRILS
ncbi:hypothetical protein COV22_03635 [Candidatus Woesearchaeota archaeon CG10_big_fil_rev_8_21_14_0_10_47_5]|nr:MAG: hypothetical protein AUJ69_03970 [Candidatus Woesearchaeota archaeon CG1_02_47_18]PIN72285.1 MAG: hypothetical protein COV22_03635 [Candidatus Woesearchaeota archaeon CG10_big_fil_rev_8_21_14_0_10_47_5]HII29472.1 methyltransferase [Candidatus Woesearchaeota archaeon]